MKTEHPEDSKENAVLVFEEVPVFYLGLENVILESLGIETSVVRCPSRRDFTIASRTKNVKCIFFNLPTTFKGLELVMFINTLKRKFGNPPLIAYSYEYQAELMQARMIGVDAVFDFAESTKNISSLIRNVMKRQKSEPIS